MVSIGEWLATASHGVADRRERRFLRSRRLRKHVLIGSADRRRKAHAVHGREKGGEPGRACRQRVPERMMAGLRDPVFAHQDLAGIYVVCSRPTLHLGELRRQTGGCPARGVAHDVRSQLVLERGTLTRREVRVLLHERKSVLQRGVRVGVVVGSRQPRQVLKAPIEQPREALPRKREG
jgi:hypothetical protein